MAVKSTQVVHVKPSHEGAAVVGSCRVIKHEHRKHDPEAEGVPQREVWIMNASGALVLRITKYFRHLLLECDGACITTDKLVQLTPDNMRHVAEEVLAVSENRRRILHTAIATIEDLYAGAADSELEDDSE